MPEHSISQEAGHPSTSSGVTGTEIGDQAHPENPASTKAGQPVGRLKKLSRQVTVLALDILEQME